MRDERIKFLDEFDKVAVSLFEVKNVELYLRDQVKALIQPTYSFPSRHICLNSQDQLEEAYNSIMRALFIIRDETNIFRILVELIDKGKIPDKTFNLDWLANDIVHFLLFEFTSSEDNYMKCLTQFEPLLNVTSLLLIANFFRQAQTNNRQQ